MGLLVTIGSPPTLDPDMPLFEYRCLSCDSHFELLIRGAMTPACPSCGGTSLERLLSMFAVSSEGESRRNRASLGAAQRQKSQANQQERTHYRHDHHDD
jgi:putative FmdB family regulatory protein